MISSLDFMKEYRNDKLMISEAMTPCEIENLSGDIMKDLLELKEKVMYSEAITWGTIIKFILNMIMKLIALAKGLYKILERFFGDSNQTDKGGAKTVEEPINNQTINIVNNYYQSAMRTDASVDRLGDTIDPTVNSKVTEDNILQYMDVNSRANILNLHKNLNNTVMSRIEDLEETLSRFRIPATFENRDTMNTLLNYIDTFSKVFEETVSYVDKDEDNKSQIFADIFAKRVTLTPLYKFTEKLYMSILKCQLPIIVTRSFSNANGHYIALNNPLSINEENIMYIDEQKRIRRSTTEGIMHALFDLRRETIKINNYDFSKIEKLDIQDIYSRLSGYLRNTSGDKIEFLEIFKSDAATIRNTITELEKAKKNIESMKEVNTKDMKEFVDSIMGLISVTLSFASLYTCVTTIEKDVVINLANWEHQMYKAFIQSIDKVSYDIFRKQQETGGI